MLVPSFAKKSMRNLLRESLQNTIGFLTQTVVIKTVLDRFHKNKSMASTTMPKQAILDSVNNDVVLTGQFFQHLYARIVKPKNELNCFCFALYTRTIIFLIHSDFSPFAQSATTSMDKNEIVIKTYIETPERQNCTCRNHHKTAK